MMGETLEGWIKFIKPAARANPQRAAQGIFADGPGGVVVQTIAVLFVVQVMFEKPARAIKFIQPPAKRREPEMAAAIFVNRPNEIMAQTVRVVGIIFIMCELCHWLGLPIVFPQDQFVQSAGSPKPNYPGIVDMNGANLIIAQTINIGRVVLVMMETFSFAIKPIQPASRRSNPESGLGIHVIFNERCNVIVT